MIYLFHGEDDLSSREAVQSLIARMKDSPVWEYNVTSLEGERLSVPGLIEVCRTTPFLSDKRLVVVVNALSQLVGGSAGASREDSRPERPTRGGKKAAMEALVGFFPLVPDFCRLVFLEEQLITDRDPLLKAIIAQGGFVKAHRLDERGVPAWIRNRANKIGCKISPAAAEELASAVGPNSRLLNSEMQKLATYCQDRPIEVDDVRLLVVDARKANVFAMVDALGQRQPEVVLKELRRLISEGDHPLRVMAMVIRQFRLLIQVKELSEAGASPEEISRQVGMPLRGVNGIQRQARNFSFGQMETAYRRLLDCDLQIKAGHREPEAALELLVMELLRAA